MASVAPSVIAHPHVASFVIRYPSSVICHPSSVIHGSIAPVECDVPLPSIHPWIHGSMHPSIASHATIIHYPSSIIHRLSAIASVASVAPFVVASIAHPSRAFVASSRRPAVDLASFHHIHRSFRVASIILHRPSIAAEHRLHPSYCTVVAFRHSIHHPTHRSFAIASSSINGVSSHRSSPHPSIKRSHPSRAFIEPSHSL
mmetsp:Transcript_9919/g.28130  ORF Transcript_9919/g.28130 Transcript_9919/m.28130 type:complete len:201 (+) Transcript_9919:179-781(+)